MTGLGLPRPRSDAALTEAIRNIHTQPRGTYGAPRIHAELRLGEDIRVGGKRVARLMAAAGIEDVYRRRRGVLHPAGPNGLARIWSTGGSTWTVRMSSG